VIHILYYKAYVLGDKNAFTATVFEITLSAVVHVEEARKSGGEWTTNDDKVTNRIAC